MIAETAVMCSRVAGCVVAWTHVPKLSGTRRDADPRSPNLQSLTAILETVCTVLIAPYFGFSRSAYPSRRRYESGCIPRRRRNPSCIYVCACVRALRGRMTRKRRRDRGDGGLSIISSRMSPEATCAVDVLCNACCTQYGHFPAPIWHHPCSHAPPPLPQPPLLAASACH